MQWNRVFRFNTRPNPLESSPRARSAGREPRKHKNDKEVKLRFTLYLHWIPAHARAALRLLSLAGKTLAKRSAGTAMLQPLKTHGVAIAIGLLSILVAYWLEPLIPHDALDILVMSTLMALGLSLWIQLQKPRISIVCSILAVCFHYCCSSCFVRQVALAIMMTGSIITFWHMINSRKSKDQV